MADLFIISTQLKLKSGFGQFLTLASGSNTIEAKILVQPLKRRFRTFR